MTKIFFDVLWFVAGLALALPLGLLAMRLMRRANPKGTMAVASALMLFLSPYFFDTRGRDLVEETGNETKRKKDSRSGDPPVTGEKTGP
jgi:hypothetical protein